MLALRAVTLLLAGFAIASFAGGGASALPLDEEACENLKVEHEAKLTPEIQEALEHGPDWVKNNLDTAKLDKVRDYLLVEERLEFQCRKGEYIKKYWDIVPLPIRRPEPPAAEPKKEQHAKNEAQQPVGQRVVSTSQARVD